MEDEKYRKINRRDCWTFTKRIVTSGFIFLERGGKISGNVFEEKYQPSSVPKGGLEIMSEVEIKIENKKRKILEKFQDIIDK